MSSGIRIAALFLLLTAVLVLSGHAPRAHADAASDIQAQIDQHSKTIQALESEIAGYQSQLTTLGTQHATLATSISSLNAQRAKLTAQIKATQQKIESENLVIKQLTLDIDAKQQNINVDKLAIAQSLRDMNASDDTTFVEQLFSSDSLSQAWVALDANNSLDEALRAHAQGLATVKSALQNQQAAIVSTTKALATLTGALVTQQGSLDATTKTQKQLLSQTKAQESSYQSLITQKRAEQASFQATIYQLESKLKAADNTIVPRAGKGILAWPVDSVTITQLFGRTGDSGRLYASGTHNGIDLGVPIGTPVHAALSGTILATNEGTAPNCQYGKWVVIKHGNGLATLYGHLSSIAVSAGQTVSTGDVIAYSGMTGYATGPHLHLSVFNAASVVFKQYTCKSGPTVNIPIAPTNGYLDPMVYLQ